jgi:hypothetical protein
MLRKVMLLFDISTIASAVAPVKDWSDSAVILLLDKLTVCSVDEFPAKAKSDTHVMLLKLRSMDWSDETFNA